MEPELKNEPEAKAEPVIEQKALDALKAEVNARLDKIEAKANRRPPRTTTIRPPTTTTK